MHTHIVATHTDTISKWMVLKSLGADGASHFVLPKNHFCATSKCGKPTERFFLVEKSIPSFCWRVFSSLVTKNDLQTTIYNSSWLGLESCAVDLLGLPSTNTTEKEKNMGFPLEEYLAFLFTSPNRKRKRKTHGQEDSGNQTRNTAFVKWSDLEQVVVSVATQIENIMQFIWFCSLCQRLLYAACELHANWIWSYSGSFVRSFVRLTSPIAYYAIPNHTISYYSKCQKRSPRLQHRYQKNENNDSKEKPLECQLCNSISMHFILFSAVKNSCEAGNDVDDDGRGGGDGG